MPLNTEVMLYKYKNNVFLGILIYTLLKLILLKFITYLLSRNSEYFLIRSIGNSYNV